MSDRRERKIVTILFADMVGFTARAESLDPEDVEAILRPYHARLREELEKRGGTVEKFVGDAVMAVFGAPVAHEDDPERAVRAAIAIRDGIVEDGKLEVRIGVNTGEALVNVDAHPATGEGMVAGDVVNTAARLQAAAPTNGILVGAATYRATLPAIDYREHAPVDAKGKSEPVEVWEAVEARARVGVELPAAATPLFGRERERELLIGAFERTRGERSTQLVTIAGVPGIGKTRLVAELYAVLEREAELTHWRQGRSLPYGEGVAFWAFAEMVKAQAGILDTDDAETAGRKLHNVAENVAGSDSSWVESRLRPLVGLAAPDAGRDESFAAWRRLVEGLAEQRPTVLVFEDLHWADDDLLDFVDELVDWLSDVPLLVVATARPELLDRRPGWGGGKRNALTHSLAPLGDDDTARLLAALLARKVLPADVQQALLARAGGNPLYAEQFARMLEERGAVEGELPENVQGIISARLDSLQPAEKQLLLDAAVLGKTFWAGALGGDDVEMRLRALQRKEFVRRERRSAVAGETEFAFTHLLVRDVAYGQIPRAERATKHAQAARWLESLTDRPEDLAELLVHHYLAALELARAAGSDAAELVEPAVGVLFDAVERAQRLNAYARTEQYATTLLEQLAPDDARRARALAALASAEGNLGNAVAVEHGKEAVQAFVALGDVEGAAELETLVALTLWQFGRRDDAHEASRRAVELVRAAPASLAKAKALAERARMLMLAGQSRESIAIGESALELARQFADEPLQARLLITIGTARGHVGEPAGEVELRRGMELADATNSVFEFSRGTNNLAQELLVRGDIAGPESLYRMTLERAERVGQMHSVAWCWGQLSWIAVMSGEWDEFERLTQRYRAVVERMGSHYLDHQICALEAMVLNARGHDADDVWARALDLAHDVKDPQALGPTLSYRARALLDSGRPENVPTLVDEVLTFTDEQGHALYYTWLIELAWLLVDLGRGDEMPSADSGGIWLRTAELVVAHDFAAAAEAIHGIPYPEAYACLRAAEQLAAAGQDAESAAYLDRALAFYRSVGASTYVRRAEALLPASA